MLGAGRRVGVGQVDAVAVQQARGVDAKIRSAAPDAATRRRRWSSDSACAIVAARRRAGSAPAPARCRACRDRRRSCRSGSTCWRSGRPSCRSATPACSVPRLLLVGSALPRYASPVRSITVAPFASEARLFRSSRSSDEEGCSSGTASVACGGWAGCAGWAGSFAAGHAASSATARRRLNGVLSFTRGTRVGRPRSSSRRRCVPRRCRSCAGATCGSGARLRPRP